LRALFPLATWFGYVMFPATFFTAVASMLLLPSIAVFLGVTVYAAFVAVAAALFALMFTANRFLKRMTPLVPFLRGYVVVLALALYISWANFRSLPATLIGRRRVFARTPKEGSALSVNRGQE
jgi:hypothetical protein